MKTVVNAISAMAFMAILIGGAAIESPSVIPFLLITSGISWFLLRIGATNMCNKRKENT